MRTTSTLSKNRIETLSDGIFAIAMTLLVLKLDVPNMMHHSSNAEMLQQLLEMAPAFFSFVITFLIAAAFWLLHHRTFHFIAHVSRFLCWVNLLLLMFVSLLPFSAGLMAHLFIHPVSQLFYFGNQLAIALLLGLHWLIIRRTGPPASDADILEARRLTYSMGTLTLALSGALLTGVFEPHYSPLSFLLILIAGSVGERWSRPSKRLTETV